jgi:uncharacterized membrane protein
MSDNLYAPPQADLGRGPELALGSGDFEIGRCSSEAWQRTWANFPLWLGAGIVFTLVFVAAAITILGLFLAIPVLYWGAFVFVLHMHDGGAKIGDLFSGFSRYGRTLAGMLGFFVVSFAASLPGSVITQIGALSNPPDFRWFGIGYAVAIGIALFVTSRLNFVPFLMIDRDLGLAEALSQAWSRTAPLKWKLALLTLFMFLVVIVGALALLIGMIPAMVMSFLLWVSAYRQIFGGAPRAAA